MPISPLISGVDFAMVPTQDFDAAVRFFGEVLKLPKTSATASIRARSSRPGT